MSADGPAYTDVYFDAHQLRQVWPPRTWLAALMRSSPPERRGNVRDWKQRDAKLDAKEREITDGLSQRMHERDARSADRTQRL